MRHHSPRSAAFAASMVAERRCAPARYRRGMRLAREALAVAALVVSGCSFSPRNAAVDASVTQPDDGHHGSSDGHLDSGGSQAACVTVASIGVHLCPSGAPSGMIDITSSATLVTDSGATSPPNAMLSCAPMTTASTPNVCAIFATSIKIEKGITLAATGTKPFVLIATDDIDVEGMLDVASHAGGVTGPGPVPAACGHNSMTPQGETGAEGGSYGTKGASGGGDEDDDTVGAPGDTIGLAALTAGCAGAVGGNGGGAGGAGGGAVLVSAPMLTIGSSGPDRCVGRWCIRRTERTAWRRRWRSRRVDHPRGSGIHDLRPGLCERRTRRRRQHLLTSRRQWNRSERVELGRWQRRRERQRRYRLRWRASDDGRGKRRRRRQR